MGQLRPNSGIGQWAYNVVVGSIKGVTFVIPILNKKQIIKNRETVQQSFPEIKGQNYTFYTLKITITCFAYYNHSTKTSKNATNKNDPINV